MNSGQCTIRKFRPSDTLAVARLIAETFATYNHREGTRQAIQDYIDFFRRDVGVLQKYLARAPIHYVAVLDGVVVGVVRGHLERLTSLFVSGAHHRHGIGRLLVRVFERQARCRRASVIKIRASLYAVPFYLAVGYKRTTGIRGFKGLRMQPMKKTLSTRV